MFAINPAVLLLRCDIRYEQFVFCFRTYINAKINWFQKIIFSIADEVVNLDKSYFSVTRICWQLVNRGDPRTCFLQVVLSLVDRTHAADHPKWDQTEI